MCEKVSPLTLFCPKHSLLLLYEESCEFRRQSTKVSVVQSRDAQRERGQSQRMQLLICISLTLYRNKHRNTGIHFSNQTNKWLWINNKTCTLCFQYLECNVQDLKAMMIPVARTYTVLLMVCFSSRGEFVSAAMTLLCVSEMWFTVFILFSSKAFPVELTFTSERNVTIRQNMILVFQSVYN